MKRSKILMRRSISALAVLVLVIFCDAAAFAQTSVFTYQGRFTDTTVTQPTNGTYTMTFRLFDAETGGTQIPNTTDITSMVSVVNGIFTAKLDFTQAAFSTSGARYLEIQVGSTVLTPRQEITATPFANRAVNATTADALSANCVGCVTSNQINSIDAGKINGTVTNATNAVNATNATTATNVSGVVSIANGGTGSTTKSFVDLTTDQTISGNKTFNNTVSSNVFNATQFNIGGNRVLSNAGTENLFAGVGTGRVNAGSFNTFVGSVAGNFNTTGGNNSFFGSGAGYATTTGANNSFFGRDAGIFNNTGGNNTLLGAFTNLNASNLNYATAVGAGATVSTSNTVVLGRAADDVRVPGDLTVSGTLNTTYGNSVTTVYGTGSLTVTRTNPNYVLIPGLRQVVNVPANAEVVVSTDGGIQTLSQTSDGTSIVYVAIFVDGAMVSERTHVIENGRVPMKTISWALSIGQAVPTGSRTIEIRAVSDDLGGLSNANVSGSSGALRGQLTVTIIKR